MTVYGIDPLGDPRWGVFLSSHSRASVFHTRGWLGALQRTYGFEPVAYTSSGCDAELRNAIVFCRVTSRLTGRRLVSVPFADHCDPLIEASNDRQEILACLRAESEKGRWKYIEIRPRDASWTDSDTFVDSEAFYLHTLELQPAAAQLLDSFDKDSVQRRIRRAEREGLTYEEGRSPTILDKFYHLLLLTRRRHRLPPQSREWFRNLIVCLGESLKIRVASRAGEPIASIVTLQYKDTMVYKYGCSDARFHNVSGTVFLFWKAIQEAKREGLKEFDFGRSDLNNPGLIRFKDQWGTRRATVRYLRYPASSCSIGVRNSRMRLAQRVLARVPDGILTLAGRLLYRHVG
jgi:CelD/BcsL family acetyltransferase involved in cellulose biosynthesis